MGHTTHSASDGLLCCSSAHLGRVKQPCGCCSVWNKILKETGRILQNFLRFSPASGEPIWKWTPQQVSYTAFPHFSPLLTQRSKTNSLVCFYPLSKAPGLVHLWLKGAAIPVDGMIITQFLNNLSQTAWSHTHPQCPWLNCCMSMALSAQQKTSHILLHRSSLFSGYLFQCFSLVIHFNVSLWLFISSFPLLTVPSMAPSNLDTLQPA